MRVGISWRTKGAEQDHPAFIALELLSVPAAVTIGMRARIVDTNMTTKEYAFPSWRRTAPTVAIPPSFLKIDKTN
jgi:hypothetical protein